MLFRDLRLLSADSLYMGFKLQGLIMRILFFWSCVSFLSQLFALNISISQGKQDGVNFSILTLKESEAFRCDKLSEDAGRSNFIKCVIPHIPDNGFSPFNTEFFKISYEMEEGRFVLFVHPVKDIHLFCTPPSLEDSIFHEESSCQSSVWQIVGYQGSLPFLSRNVGKITGLNFPIQINPGEFEYIGGMDVNKNPLLPVAQPDYSEYLKIKEYMDTQRYKLALVQIAETFRKYPNTFFLKDLLFFEIEAFFHLGLYDNVIENATSWIRFYSSDNQIPFMLYILANSYAAIRLDEESKYYYDRILKQYPESRFSPLSKMRLADLSAKNNAAGMARVYFSQAYQEAKDLDSASEIALEWAFFEIQNPNHDIARDLVEKVLQSNSIYFKTHPKVTLDMIEALNSRGIYGLAASLGQYYFDNTSPQDDFHEKIGFLLGDIYALDKNFDAAHKSYQDFIQQYPNLASTHEILKKDDEILFEVNGDDATKLERYDYIMQKYPSTKAYVDALRLKASLLLKLGEYQEVLELPNLLQNSKDLYQKAVWGLFNENKDSNSCMNLAGYLSQIEDFSGLENKGDVFDCLYEARLYPLAHKISSQELQDLKEQEGSASKLLFWLYREARVLNALDRYKDSILAARDVLSLSKTQYDSEYQDILFTQFDNFIHTDISAASNIYGDLYSHFKEDSRMMRVYSALLDKQPNLDPSTVLIYASNLLKLSSSKNITDYTPVVDFRIIEAFKALGENKSALEAVNLLIEKKISPENKQKALYFKASLQMSLGESGSSALEQCLDIKEMSSWRSLCKQLGEISSEKPNALVAKGDNKEG